MKGSFKQNYVDVFFVESVMEMVGFFARMTEV
jgi:hypothetical protein